MKRPAKTKMNFVQAGLCQFVLVWCWFSNKTSQAKLCFLMPASFCGYFHAVKNGFSNEAGQIALFFKHNATWPAQKCLQSLHLPLQWTCPPPLVQNTSSSLSYWRIEISETNTLHSARTERWRRLRLFPQQIHHWWRF